MINVGDTLYAARDITFHDIYGDGSPKVMFSKGVEGEVIEEVDYGPYTDDDLSGLRILVGFSDHNHYQGFEYVAFEYSDLTLFTKVKPE